MISLVYGKKLKATKWAKTKTDKIHKQTTVWWSPEGQWVGEARKGKVGQIYVCRSETEGQQSPGLLLPVTAQTKSREGLDYNCAFINDRGQQSEKVAGKKPNIHLPFRGEFTQGNCNNLGGGISWSKGSWNRKGRQ